MISNFIPITAEAPLYPASHIETLRQRVTGALPALPSEGVDRLLCDLFGVVSLHDIQDSHEILENHETQPAVSSSELDTLANRVLAYFDSELPLSAIKRSVCGIINSVPKTVADLIDYMHPDDIAQINYMFAVTGRLADKLGWERVTSSELVPEILAMEDQNVINMAGAVIMDGHNTKPFNADPDIPERQSYLRRAAEFYLLHLYGYPVASLWLAQNINPMAFCHCPNVDCESRAFGFTDASGCVELVTHSIDYIRETLLRDSGSVSTASGVCYDDIVMSYMELMLSAVETLLTIDQTRARGGELQVIIELLTQYQALLDKPDACRLLALNAVAQHLYPKTDLLPPGITSGEHLDVHSINMTAEYTRDVKAMPDQKHMYLFDAQNFFAHGITWQDAQMGARLRTLFLSSLFDRQTIEEFVEIVDMLLGSDATPDELKSLLSGYKNNGLGVLGRRGRAFPELLPAVSEHAGTELSVIELSELGCCQAIARRIDQYLLDGSIAEQGYWMKRLVLAEEFGQGLAS